VTEAGDLRTASRKLLDLGPSEAADRPSPDTPLPKGAPALSEWPFVGRAAGKDRVVGQLSRHEGQAWREAPGWEASFAIALLQLLGRRAEGRHEPGVHLVEGPPRRLGRCVHEWGRRTRQLGGTILRSPREDRVHALLSLIQDTELSCELVLFVLSRFPGRCHNTASLAQGG
jgi:hypothetical protein